jgi:hypothetical protein
MYMFTRALLRVFSGHVFFKNKVVDYGGRNQSLLLTDIFDYYVSTFMTTLSLMSTCLGTHYSCVVLSTLIHHSRTFRNPGTHHSWLVLTSVSTLMSTNIIPYLWGKSHFLSPMYRIFCSNTRENSHWKWLFDQLRLTRCDANKFLFTIVTLYVTTDLEGVSVLYYYW